MPWQKINDYVVIDCPEYTWELDEFRNEPDGTDNEQMMFIHLKVHKWSKSVLKEMTERFRLFREVIPCPLYAAVDDVEDDKWIKFITHFGFQQLAEIDCDGKPRRLYWLPPLITEEKKHEQFFDENREHLSEPKPERDLAVGPVVGAATLHSARLPDCC